MLVSNYKTILHVTGNSGLILGYRIFSNSVGLTGIQSLKGVFPVVSFGQNYRVNLATVCQQVHGNRSGTDTILIVCIVPNLFYSNAGCFHIGIGNSQSCLCLTSNDLLCSQCYRIAVGGGQQIGLAADRDRFIRTSLSYGVSTRGDRKILLRTFTLKGYGLICCVILQHIDGVVLFCGKAGNDLFNIQLNRCPLSNQLNVGDQPQLCIFSNQISRLTVNPVEIIVVVTIYIISSFPASEVVTLGSRCQLCFLGHSICNMLPITNLCRFIICILKLSIGGLIAAGAVIVGTAGSDPFAGVSKCSIATHDAAFIRNIQRFRNRCDLDQNEVLFLAVLRLRRPGTTMCKGIAGHIQRNCTASTNAQFLGEFFILCPSAALIRCATVTAGNGNLGYIVAGCGGDGQSLNNL